MTQQNTEAPNEAPLTATQQRALALRENIGGADVTAIVPRNFAEVRAFAGDISTSNLIPQALRQRAPDVLMMILSGMELGLAPMVSLRSFHVIEGVAKLTADALTAVCRAAPECDYIRPVEMSSEKCVWAAKRKGEEEVRNTWTIDDAKRAGLVRKTSNGADGMWMKYPKQMLNARCKAELAKLVFPERAAGITTVEEVDSDFDPNSSGGFVAPLPTNATPASTTPAKPAANAKPPKASKPKTDDAIDVSFTETKTTDAPSGVMPGSAEAMKQADAAIDKVTEAREAAKTVAETAPDIKPAPADDGGFGDEEEPAAPLEETDDQKFERFNSELSAAKTDADCAAVKAAWLPWAKKDAPGAKYAPRMKEAFAKRTSEIAGK